MTYDLIASKQNKSVVQATTYARIKTIRPKLSTASKRIVFSFSLVIFFIALVIGGALIDSVSHPNSFPIDFEQAKTVYKANTATSSATEQLNHTNVQHTETSTRNTLEILNSLRMKNINRALRRGQPDSVQNREIQQGIDVDISTWREDYKQAARYKVQPHTR
ncbi:MAG: hypothetical protein AAGJ37_05775 [Pseudomonadota bacterium]